MPSGGIKQVYQIELTHDKFDVKFLYGYYKDMNLTRIPITRINPLKDTDYAQEFITYCRNKYGEPTTFVRTRKGYISKNLFNFYYNKWEMREMPRRGWQFTINDKDWGIAEISLMCAVDMDENAEQPVKGTTALGKVLENCPQLKEYNCEDVEENKEWRRKAKKFYDITRVDNGDSFYGITNEGKKYLGQTLENCVWSLDLNSAFASSLAFLVPSTQPYLSALYNGRKIHKKNKGIMVSAVGMMCCAGTTRLGISPGGLSKLRYQILEDTCNVLNIIAREIEEQGGTVLMFRTDSIKFIWPHKEKPQISIIRENNYLGGFKYDFMNAEKFRIWSEGKYEYEYNGAYYPVLQGRSSYDDIVPRSEWQWGDVNKGKVITWKLDTKNWKIIIKEAY